MKNIEFIKRNSSENLINEFPNSTFVSSKYDFTDAIIGVTVDGKIVYNRFKMEAIIYRSNDQDGYDFTEYFNNKDEYEDFIDIEVCMIENQFQSTYYNENPPIFCTDREFLENSYPCLNEFETGVFQSKIYDVGK